VIGNEVPEALKKDGWIMGAKMRLTRRCTFTFGPNKHRKDVNAGTICVVRGAQGNDKIYTEFETTCEGRIWKSNPAVKLSNLELCNADDCVGENKAPRQSLPDSQSGRKRAQSCGKDLVVKRPRLESNHQEQGSACPAPKLRASAYARTGLGQKKTKSWKSGALCLNA